jgi:hypothetical protein
MMVDPAIGTRPGQAGAFDRGSEEDVWLKGPDGKDHIGSEYISFEKSIIN